MHLTGDVKLRGVHLTGNVKLRPVHHTEKSGSALCITPRSQALHCASLHTASQTAHRGIRIEHFAGLWLLLKGQSGEIHLGVNIYIMKEKI